MPSAAESGMVQVGMMIFSLITISLGTAAFAAQQIVFTIANLSMIPGVAFSTAATTLVGQSLGAGDPERAEASGWRGARSAAWMSVMGAAFLIIPEPLARLFTDDPGVSAGSHGIMVMGFGQPLQGFAFTLSGALRGAGDTKTTMQRGTSRCGSSDCRSRTSAASCSARRAGHLARLGGDWALRGVFYVIAFRRGAWKKMRSQKVIRPV